MVQKKYEVQLSSQEKGRLRKMIRLGQEFGAGDDPGADSAEDK